MVRRKKTGGNGVRTDESSSANKCGSGKRDRRKALSIELSDKTGLWAGAVRRGSITAYLGRRMARNPDSKVLHGYGL
jgi:hypothetical protein